MGGHPSPAVEGRSSVDRGKVTSHGPKLPLARQGTRRRPRPKPCWFRSPQHRGPPLPALFSEEAARARRNMTQLGVPRRDQPKGERTSFPAVLRQPGLGPGAAGTEQEKAKTTRFSALHWFGQEQRKISALTRWSLVSWSVRSIPPIGAHRRYPDRASVGQ